MSLFPARGKHSTSAMRWKRFWCNARENIQPVPTCKPGKTISWRNAREKNSACFQARKNIQLAPSAGKQLGDVMRGKGIQPVSKRGKTSAKCGKTIKWCNARKKFNLCPHASAGNIQVR